MPTLLLLTWAVELAAPRRSSAAVLWTGLGFALPLLLLVGWLFSHPEMLRDTFGRYHIYDARRLTPLQGFKQFLNYNGVQERISVYWDFFNPAFLFFSGGSNLTTSTRITGVFLWPTLVLLPVGLYGLTRGRRPIDLVIVAGFCLSPLAAVLVGERYAVQRELVVVPFGVLIMTNGATTLLRQRSAIVRILCVCLLSAMPLLYASFLRDYFGDYQDRSAYWFDPVNFRGVASRVLALDATRQVPEIFFSGDLDAVESRWRFELIKNGRLDMVGKTHYFDAPTLETAPVSTGSVFVGYATDPRLKVIAQSGTLSLVDTIMSVSGAPSAVILRKTR